MKTSSSSYPALVCHLTRLQQSVFGKPGIPRAGHAARCADCQRYFKATVTLELGLQSESRRHAGALPSGLDERVLQAVARSARAELEK